MSDPVSKSEIEDVLASIRRLVSEDTRFGGRPPTVPRPPRGEAGTERLVLTPALRVASGAEARGGDGGDSGADGRGGGGQDGVIADGGGMVGDVAGETSAPEPEAEASAPAEPAPAEAETAEAETAAETAGEAAADRAPWADPNATLFGVVRAMSVSGDEARGRADDEDMSGGDAAGEGSPGEDASGEDEAAVLQPAVEDAGADAAAADDAGDAAEAGTSAAPFGAAGDGEWLPPLNGDDAGDDAGSDADAGAAGAAASGDGGGDGDGAGTAEHAAGADGADGLSGDASGAAKTAEATEAAEDARRAAELAAKIQALEAAIGRTRETWDPDDPGVDEYAGTPVGTIRWEDHEADAGADAGADADGDGAAPAAEGEADVLAADETILDEASLRELVIGIVREELQGTLGERITRNVRKLVRREIHRALAMRDFD